VLWDPASGRLKRVDPPLVPDPQDGGKLKPANIWCSGQSLMGDGQLLVTGGNLAYQGTRRPGSNVPYANYPGLKTAFTFNPWNETWTRQPDMQHGRWYPSQALLPDGRTVVMSGLDESGGGFNTNKDIEVFEPSPDLDGPGAMTKLTERGRRLEDGAADPLSPHDGDLYPHLFVLPGEDTADPAAAGVQPGRLLVAGPNMEDSWLLRPPGDPGVWTNLASPDRRRLWATGVLEPGGPSGSHRALVIGGSSPQRDSEGKVVDAGTVATSVAFDERANVFATEPAAMTVARSHHNTVLLPDGSMVTVGGGVGTDPDRVGQWSANEEHRRVELFDPATGAWRLGAAQAEGRAYHSTALLLPDARVISAGDDVNGGIDIDTAEIYEPRYLFDANNNLAPRPEIADAPGGVAYDAPFDVASPSSGIASAMLVAPGATTHANDMSQRAVPLRLAPSPSGVALRAPSKATIAPPGYYMLFIVNAQGVPSLARWVRLGGDGAPGATLVVRQQSDTPGAKFAFEAGPAAFELAHGEERRITVPAGPYTATQEPEPGHRLDAISCGPGPAETSLAARRASLALAAGETRTCTFENSAVPADPPIGSTPPVIGPAPAGTPDTSADRLGPMLVFGARRGFTRTTGLLRGRAIDTSGVRAVQVALGVRRGARCAWWSQTRRRLGALRRGACRRPAYLRAKLRGEGPIVSWSARLRGRVPRSRYVVALRGVDRRGNAALRRLRLRAR